ncbi:DNA repair protein RadA [Rhizohabitans arisaemae]|uniref:DNA repair protein RadA n=1 Tax=Rhizohabitans arisaemae TaxID=2720610 RepID=UPI0024B05883|nr:DNA repair protein RadA [Rhizohabitans arisaemae]
MAKASTSFRCAECGWQTTKWVGRCGECQSWSTMEEVGAPSAVTRAVSAGRVTAPALPIGEVPVDEATALPTGMDELDRVLGGGLVPGAVLLLAGEPGVGKSTLLLEMAALRADRAKVLYVTGEESAAQVRLRADRVGALAPHLYLAAETELGALVAHVEAVRPELLIVDSVQTIASTGVTGTPGGMTQVRDVASNLIKVAKDRNLATVLVGHVTKDGSIAGPRALEHLVDVVLYFEGERHSRLRMIRAVKNRYGPTDEIGCFDLSDSGLAGLPDPSGLFLTHRVEPAAGTCVTVTLEGRRPLVAEVQALVVPTHPEANPRRTTAGLENARMTLVLAALQRHGKVRLNQHDVYAGTVGGVRLTEPSVDLAVALAVAGSSSGMPLPSGFIALGEVGLAGEIRRVQGVRRRLGEAARLGFRHAVVPTDSITADSLAPNSGVPEGMTVTETSDLASAIRAAFG